MAWTGSEVIVLGGERHRDGAAFDPARGDWRPISPSPLPAGLVRTVWTGSSLIAVTGPTGARAAAAYDPRTDAWQALAAPPPSRFPNVSGSARPPALHWAGGEVVLVDAWAAYDPRTDRWRDLPTPQAGHMGIDQTQAVAAAERQMWLLGAGGTSHRFDFDTGRWTALPSPPTVASNGFADAVAVGGDVYFASEDGQVHRLAGDDWSPVHVAAGGGGCAPEAVSVLGQPVFKLCHGIVAASPGRWQQIPTEARCCYRTLVSSGTALFEWDSNDDARNDPTAPRKAFHVWRPD
ncbi:MAG TPA: hypothetical protein VM390_10235 [Acidimicrobiales bacterium]|nr:hypothetical protein [Acidimicrobiales bacterium]